VGEALSSLCPPQIIKLKMMKLKITMVKIEFRLLRKKCMDMAPSLPEKKGGSKA
jgi:hypothetical protein